MAPQNKPMPTSSSMRSPLDPRYAEAMSNLYKGMKKAAAQGLFSPTDVERNFSQFKRVVRVLFSQGDNFVTDYFQNENLESLADAKKAKEFSTKVFNQLSGDPAQKAMNYAPGIIEGHHPVSVESTFQAGKHLIDAGRWDDFFEFQRVLFNEYGVGGTVAENQYPLSKFGHQGKGTRAKEPFPVPTAHTTANPLAIVEAEGFPVDTGTWGKEFNFSGITNPRKLAKAFMEQSGFPQMMMADKAMDSPQEIAIRNELAQKLGIRERELYSLGKDFKTRGPYLRQLIKDSGIDVNEIVYRNYGLPVPERKSIPSRDPNAPKVPKTTKPTVVPTFAEAEQFAKGWLTEEDFLPDQGTSTLDAPVEYRAGLPMPSRQFIKQNTLGAGAGAVTGAITPESAYAAGKGDWRTAAVEGVKAAATGAITGGAIQAGLTNLMPRVAAGLASGPVMPLVAGVGTALTLQDAAQAYRAGQSGRSIPLQKKVEQAQQDKRRQQDVAQFRAAMPGVASKNRMQADLSGRLSPQQIESFKAGGGNAAMMRDGLSVQQVIERGSSLRLKKIVNSTIRDQV